MSSTDVAQVAGAASIAAAPAMMPNATRLVRARRDSFVATMTAMAAAPTAIVAYGGKRR